MLRRSLLISAFAASLVPTVWAAPLSLATTQGIASLSFPPLTEMFHFSGFRSYNTIYSCRSTDALPPVGFPIRISPG